MRSQEHVRRRWGRDAAGHYGHPGPGIWLVGDIASAEITVAAGTATKDLGVTVRISTDGAAHDVITASVSGGDDQDAAATAIAAAINADAGYTSSATNEVISITPTSGSVTDIICMVDGYANNV